MSAVAVVSDSVSLAPADLQRLLDRAARFQRQHDKFSAAAKEAREKLDSTKRLIAAAVPAEEQLAAAAVATKGGGKSWTLSSSRGVAVRVTQPAAKLLTRISGALATTLRGLCGDDAFEALFLTHHTCVPRFRELAYQHLDRDQAADLIARCEEPSTPTVTVG